MTPFDLSLSCEREQDRRAADASPLGGINETLSEAVCARVREVQGPVRLSEMFLKLWCGKHAPPEELVLWLKDRGLVIEAGLDAHGGYDVRLAGQEPEWGGLF